MPRTPCENCPWRKDVPRGEWPSARWQQLYQTCQDDGLQVMACHKSRSGEDSVCVGYAVQVGFDAPGLRLLASFGHFKPDRYSAGGLELYADFDAILGAEGIDLPTRNRRKF